MTTHELVAALHAKSTGHDGYTFRCPAHDDRSPSGTIREGRGGRVLIYCWAGCSTEAVMQAIGLSLSDLFEAPDSPPSYHQRRPPNAARIETALQEELQRIVAAESQQAGFDVAVLARHRNRARDAINRRYDLVTRNAEVGFERNPWFEVEPYAVDPLWTACVDAACIVVAAKASLSSEELLRIIDLLPKTQYLAIRLARRFQRSLVNRAQTSARTAA